MGVNKVILIGNLGADPELRYTQSQMAVVTLRVATSERRKGADGQWAEHTEWHSVVAFGKTAENCSQFLAKGRSIYVEGRLQTRKWQDKNGNDRYTTEIVASTIQFLGGKGEGAPTRGAAASAPASDESASFSGDTGAPAPVSFDDDDIPF